MPNASYWAFKAFIGISGVGSDVARDICWTHPELNEDSSSVNCPCKGLSVLDGKSCSFPGIRNTRTPDLQIPEEFTQFPQLYTADQMIKDSYSKYGWSFVDRDDIDAFRTSIVEAWIAMLIIISILFVGILFIQRLKDVR
jgi:hypothetical protein